jgi:hypothetical protein
VLCANICQTKLPKFDYYVCSGALNILSNFETHLFLRNCYEACDKGFIFNILHGDTQSQIYNYLSLKQIEQIAKELGVWKMEIKIGYLEDDISVAFLKEKH